MKNYMGIGIYIGITLCIILLNLISYITLKNTTYLFYTFAVLGMSVNAFYKDGITALLFGINGINETQETTLSSIIVISSIFFTTKYLSLKEHLPKLRMTGIYVVILSIILNLIYQFTTNFIIFTLTNILHILALDIFWVTGLLLWKKLPEARFFTIAYGVPLLFVHDFYISPHIGICVLNLPLEFYKIGSVFEMIVFTIAITLQSKRIRKENKEIRKKLIDFTNKFKNQNLDLNKGTVTSEELIKQYSFTIREIDVLKKVSDNKTNKEIASLLFISENTVKFHIRNILQKLEVKNRKAASNKYLKFIKDT